MRFYPPEGIATACALMVEERILRQNPRPFPLAQLFAAKHIRRNRLAPRSVASTTCSDKDASRSSPTSRVFPTIDGRNAAHGRIHTWGTASLCPHLQLDRGYKHFPATKDWIAPESSRSVFTGTGNTTPEHHSSVKPFAICLPRVQCAISSLFIENGTKKALQRRR